MAAKAKFDLTKKVRPSAKRKLKLEAKKPRPADKSAKLAKIKSPSKRKGASKPSRSGGLGGRSVVVEVTVPAGSVDLVEGFARALQADAARRTQQNDSLEPDYARMSLKALLLEMPHGELDIRRSPEAPDDGPTAAQS